jgi:hypothetical protein
VTYSKRYAAGDHVQVWDDLSALGDAVRGAAVHEDAVSVARMTMERVAANIDRLVDRLTSDGYEFGKYPGGEPMSFIIPGRVKPNASSRADVDELERLAGAIPLSPKSFWQAVGSVDLNGRARRGWPEFSDPLCVEDARSGIVEFREWRADPDPSKTLDSEPFKCPIAPDVIHKDNVSGGPPYSIRLPDLSADGALYDEWHSVRFVQYLRIAILAWGGFPGLSQENPCAKWRTRPVDQATLARVKELTNDLVPF